MAVDGHLGAARARVTLGRAAVASRQGPVVTAVHDGSCAVTQCLEHVSRWLDCYQPSPLPAVSRGGLALLRPQRGGHSTRYACFPPQRCWGPAAEASRCFSSQSCPSW